MSAAAPWENDPTVGTPAPSADTPWDSDPTVAARSEGATAGFRAQHIGAADYYNPVSGSDVENFLAGAGHALHAPVLGASQRAGMTSPAAADTQLDADTPLLATKAGAAGDFVGKGLMSAGAAVLAGPSALAGGVVGAVQGALTPTAHDESAEANTATGSFLGANLNKLSGLASDAMNMVKNNAALQAAAANVKNQVNQVAVRLGFKLDPVESNPASDLNQKLVGYTGQAKLQTAAIIENQPKTNATVITDFGLPAETQPSHQVMNDVRDQVSDSHYKPVGRELGLIDVSNGELDHAIANVGAATIQQGTSIRAFAGLRDRVYDLLDNTRLNAAGQPITQIKADDVLELIKTNRAQATSLFQGARQGGASAPSDRQMASAHIAMADALESFIEDRAKLAAQTARVLGNQTQAATYAKIIPDYQEGRRLVAKTFTVDRVLEANGDVNAVKLAALQNGAQRVPLDGGMKIVADIASHNPRVMAPAIRRAGKATVNMADTALAGAAAITAKAASGNLSLSAIAGILGAGARPAVRKLVLSRLYQSTQGLPTTALAPNNLGPAAAGGIPQGIQMFNNTNFQTDNPNPNTGAASGM